MTYNNCARELVQGAKTDFFDSLRLLILLAAVLPNKARIPGTVSSITVVDHGRDTIEKLIDHAVSRNKLESRVPSIDIEPSEVFT